MIKRIVGAGILSIVLGLGCNKPQDTAKKPADSCDACAAAPTTKPVAATRPAFAPIGAAHLHNAHRVTDKVISGAQPEGEESFKELAGLGVRTIISVDGAQPDVELARKYGIRYVHVPTRYNGVTNEQGKAVAKALMDMPGPIYVHCHHGKHRSAAAVAVACVGLDMQIAFQREWTWGVPPFRKVPHHPVRSRLAGDTPEKSGVSCGNHSGEGGTLVPSLCRAAITLPDCPALVRNH